MLTLYPTISVMNRDFFGDLLISICVRVPKRFHFSEDVDIASSGEIGIITGMISDTLHLVISPIDAFLDRSDLNRRIHSTASGTDPAPPI